MTGPLPWHPLSNYSQALTFFRKRSKKTEIPVTAHRDPSCHIGGCTAFPPICGCNIWQGVSSESMRRYRAELMRVNGGPIAASPQVFGDNNGIGRKAEISVSRVPP